MTDGNIIYASESVMSLLEHLPVSIIWITADHFYVANPLHATIDNYPAPPYKIMHKRYLKSKFQSVIVSRF